MKLLPCDAGKERMAYVLYSSSSTVLVPSSSTVHVLQYYSTVGSTVLTTVPLRPWPLPNRYKFQPLQMSPEFPSFIFSSLGFAPACCAFAKFLGHRQIGAAKERTSKPFPRFGRAALTCWRANLAAATRGRPASQQPPVCCLPRDMAPMSALFVCAMESEAVHLRRRLSDVEELASPAPRAWRVSKGVLHGADVRLLLCNIGEANAAGGTSAVLASGWRRKFLAGVDTELRRICQMLLHHALYHATTWNATQHRIKRRRGDRWRESSGLVGRVELPKIHMRFVSEWPASSYLSKTRVTVLRVQKYVSALLCSDR